MDNRDPLMIEIESIRNRLSEALEALEAIRSGGVDALVVYGGEHGEQIYTLEGADQIYRVMVETINEGAATLSEDGVITWANAYLAEMLKIPLETLLGSQILTYIAPGDRKTFEAVLLKSRKEKYKTELDLQALDGSFIPVLASFSPIISSGQTTIAMVTADLTEHKLNIEIAAAERVAKAIIEQAAEYIVVCDKDGKIVQASQSALQLTGDNPMFKSFHEAFPLSYEANSQTGTPFSIEAVLSGEAFKGIEASLNIPNKATSLVLHLSAKHLHIPGNGKLGCVITMTDVTERKQAEQDILRYAKRLESSNKDLEDFAFIASHDLQEPLRKIQSFGKLLIDNYHDRLNETGVDFIHRMQEAASRMEKMISDLLAYSRVGRQGRSFETVDLNNVCARVLMDLESRIVTTGAQIEVGELPTIEADSLQMHQLLQNLIGNAIKFHKPGERPEINVSSRWIQNEGYKPQQPHTSEIEILIEDNGIGFDMQYLERIFQPFQRLHGRSEFEGSGIGLSICCRIVERHYGSITATSRPDVGSIFSLRLPVHQNQHEP